MIKNSAKSKRQLAINATHVGPALRPIFYNDLPEETERTISKLAVDTEVGPGSG